ncbi:hypothetical protein MM26B8_03790 [Mycoplasmopsis meleagridis]|uniref:Uncharacterized protein n=1 Tax=Mycoplasmopsis meleagridis ATCC 25294 TaxID=1264554 RepID=A0A0F5H1Z9_9BACT|nr:hypothetical protein [Mycoplasmopsis meleagridis]KKB26867.1 hypothetical protein MMELEA_04430 [Mycoplasmopsis meleagridis ATCC 25294]OAD18304.1 hypothetical protein MM26B8_03790 [Mycoplasmopsis meleagridis]VEU77523.1 Uncharacterised protein [Mycoplasmopsis meleagridis]
MKKKYIFILPSLFSTITLPFVASQISASSANNSSTNNDNNSSQNEEISAEENIKKLESFLKTSLASNKAKMIETVNNITQKLSEIYIISGISLSFLGSKTNESYLNASESLANRIMTNIDSKDYEEAVNNILQLTDFVNSLNKDYNSVKEIYDLFNSLKEEIKVQIVSKAQNIYETVKNEYQKRNQENNLLIEPPIQLLANSYAREITSLNNSLIDAKNPEINNLKQTLNENTNELDNLNSSLEKQKEQIKTFNDEINEKNLKIQKLKNEKETNISINKRNKSALIATSSLTALLFVAALSLVSYLIFKKKILFKKK